MATAEQIKSLIRSHLSDDDERFYTLALQVAAHEAHQGHGALAHDIREIIDKSRRSRGSNSLLKFPLDLEGRGGGVMTWNLSVKGFLDLWRATLYFLLAAPTW